MARRKQQINTSPGYVVYLRTSTEEAQAPQRSQDGQRRDVQALLKHYPDLPFISEFIDNFTGTSADRKAYAVMLLKVRQAFSRISSPRHRTASGVTMSKPCVPLTNSPG